MIIFYNQQSKEIVGCIEGRKHDKAHLNMYIGDPEINGRLVVQWKPVKEYKDEKGQTIAFDYSPDHEQADLFGNLDKNPSDLYSYKVVDNKLVLKN